MRRVFMCIAAAIGITGSLVGPAFGADSAAPDLRFCLTYANGAAYASKPVYLMRWNGAQAVLERRGQTAANGCGTFRNVQPNSYYYVHGYWTYTVGWSVLAYSGYTPWSKTGGAANAVHTAPAASVAGPFRLY